MLKLLLKILAVLLLIALSIIIFIKLLPWALALTAIAALAKLTHDWLVCNGFIAPGWWKRGEGPQAPPPQ